MTHARHAVAALASLCLIACGGGGDDAAPVTFAPALAPALASTHASTPASTTPVPTSVLLEGCVLDGHEQPLSTAVQAVGEDGRLVSLALSSSEGLFRMQVPARSQLTLGLQAAGQARLPLLTGTTSLSLGACLRDTTA